MFTVFIVVQILLTLALVGLILVQRNDSDGLGGLGGGGGGNAFMTGRGAANLMTRGTAILATLFMLNSLWLAIMASYRGGDSLASQIEQAESVDGTAAPSVPLADEPVVPATAPKLLEPEMPVITTTEPEGEPVTAEPAADAPAADETGTATEAEEAPAAGAEPAETVPTP